MKDKLTQIFQFNKFDKKIVKIITLFSSKLGFLALFILFALYLFLFNFVHFSGDDFMLFADWTNSSINSYIDKYIFTFGPRYFTFLNLRILATFCYHVFIYRIVLATIFILFTLTIYFVIKKLEIFTDSRISLISTFILLILYLNQMPDLATSIYWLSSVIGFQLPLIFFLILFYLIIGKSTEIRSKYENGIRVSKMFILVFFIIGSNELAILQLISFLGFILIFSKHFQINKVHIICLLGFSVILAVINYRSLGGVRIEMQKDSKDMIYSLNRSAAEIYSYLRTWFTPSLILASLYLLFNIDVSEKRIKPISPVFFISVVFVFLFFELFLLFWGVGSQYTPYRLISTFWFFFLFQWIFLVIFIQQILKKSYGIIFRKSKARDGIIVLFFIYSICTTGNTLTVMKDYVSKRVTGYEQQMSSRIERIKNNPSIKYHEFPALTNVPKSIFIHDINGNDNYIDVWYCDFYRLDSVKIIEK